VDEQVKLIRQRQQLRAVMGLLAAEGKATADLQPLLERWKGDRPARPQIGGYVAASQGKL
jgi:hypothetical protein